MHTLCVMKAGMAEMAYFLTENDKSRDLMHNMKTINITYR